MQRGPHGPMTVPWHRSLSGSTRAQTWTRRQSDKRPRRNPVSAPGSTPGYGLHCRHERVSSAPHGISRPGNRTTRWQVSWLAGRHRSFGLPGGWRVWMTSNRPIPSGRDPMRIAPDPVNDGSPPTVAGSAPELLRPGPFGHGSRRIRTGFPFTLPVGRHHLMRQYPSALPATRTSPGKRSKRKAFRCKSVPRHARLWARQAGMRESRPKTARTSTVSRLPNTTPEVLAAKSSQSATRPTMGWTSSMRPPARTISRATTTWAN